MKPHKGRITNWSMLTHYDNPDAEGLKYVIWGTFLDHPDIRHGRTSWVYKYNEKSGEIETRNSRYTLVKTNG